MSALIFRIRAWIAGSLYEMNRDLIRESETDVLPDFNLTKSARQKFSAPSVQMPEFSHKIDA